MRFLLLLVVYSASSNPIGTTNTIIKLEASNGFEPMIRQLQCLALPLGYEAINMLYHYNFLSV